MSDSAQCNLFEQTKVEQTKVVATFEFAVRDSDLDPDMAASWLSEDADVTTAALIEFSMGGVTFRRSDTGYWEADTESAGDVQ